MDYIAEIEDYIKITQETLSRLDVQAIAKAMEILCEALEGERNIYVFGNGGSASTASHFQADFNKGVSVFTDKKFRFHCLSDNTATLTAIANDIGYDEVFCYQLKGRLKKEDVVIAISGSGNSGNIIKAVEYAKEVGARVIGLTGYDGGKLGRMADVHMQAVVNSMQITEDVHLILNHMMMSILCKKYGGKCHIS